MRLFLIPPLWAVGSALENASCIPVRSQGKGSYQPVLGYEPMVVGGLESWRWASALISRDVVTQPRYVARWWRPWIPVSKECHVGLNNC